MASNRILSADRGRAYHEVQHEFSQVLDAAKHRIADSVDRILQLWLRNEGRAYAQFVEAVGADIQCVENVSFIYLNTIGDIKVERRYETLQQVALPMTSGTHHVSCIAPGSVELVTDLMQAQNDFDLWKLKSAEAYNIAQKVLLQCVTVHDVRYWAPVLLPYLRPELRSIRLKPGTTPNPVSVSLPDIGRMTGHLIAARLCKK